MGGCVADSMGRTDAELWYCLLPIRGLKSFTYKCHMLWFTKTIQVKDSFFITSMFFFQIGWDYLPRKLKENSFKPLRFIYN